MKRALGLYAACVYAFLHVPLAVLAVFSFNSSRFTRWEGFSLNWYRAAAANPQLAEAAWNSLVIGFVSTVISTSVGTLAAYGLWKRRSRFLAGSLYLTLLTPEIVTGVSLLVFFQWLFRVPGLQLGMHTVVAAHVTFSIAFVAVVVLARLRTLDATLEEAAMDLGAPPWQGFFRVTVPLIRPAIVAAALLAFTVSFDDYVITSMVAGVDSETLPMVIYAIARRGANPELNAVSTIVVTALGALVLLSERLRQA